MPLVLKLAPHEKIIVNGVVIENGEDHAKLVIHNRGTILRGKDAVLIEEADTPARRAFYALQCLYLFPAERQVYLPTAESFLADIAGAAPSLAPLVEDIIRNLGEQDIYRALKLAKRLIAREQEILAGWQGRTGGDEIPGEAADLGPVMGETNAAPPRSRRQSEGRDRSGGQSWPALTKNRFTEF